MQFRAYALILSVIAIACQVPYEFGRPQGAPETVPLLRLISDPESHDGQEVWVVGVMRVEHEGNAIYIGREHFEHRLWEYSVWLSFDEEALGVSPEQLERLNGRYAYVSGIFNASEHGHGVRRNGSIEDVVQILSVDD